MVFTSVSPAEVTAWLLLLGDCQLVKKLSVPRSILLSLCSCVLPEWATDEELFAARLIVSASRSRRRSKKEKRKKTKSLPSKKKRRRRGTQVPMDSDSMSDSDDYDDCHSSQSDSMSVATIEALKQWPNIERAIHLDVLFKRKAYYCGALKRRFSDVSSDFDSGSKQKHRMNNWDSFLLSTEIAHIGGESTPLMYAFQLTKLPTVCVLRTLIPSEQCEDRMDYLLTQGQFSVRCSAVELAVTCDTNLRRVKAMTHFIKGFDDEFESEGSCDERLDAGGWLRHQPIASWAMCFVKAIKSRDSVFRPPVICAVKALKNAVKDELVWALLTAVHNHGSGKRFAPLHWCFHPFFTAVNPPTMEMLQALDPEHSARNDVSFWQTRFGEYNALYHAAKNDDLRFAGVPTHVAVLHSFVSAEVFDTLLLDAVIRTQDFACLRPFYLNLVKTQILLPRCSFWNDGAVAAEI